MYERALYALFLGLIVMVAAGGTAAAEPTDTSRIEDMVRQYFRDIQDYDFEALRAAATPQFEILDDGYRRDIAGLVAELRDKRQAKGFKYQFQLSKFNTVVTPEVAYTTFETHETVTNTSLGDHSRDSLTCMILRRVGNHWRVDRLFHLPYGRAQA
ncbi:MAG: nuclear transport factor 2 family protein, partial [Steroidobacteraceae bacterium]